MDERLLIQADIVQEFKNCAVFNSCNSWYILNKLTGNVLKVDFEAIIEQEISSFIPFGKDCLIAIMRRGVIRSFWHCDSKFELRYMYIINFNTGKIVEELRCIAYEFENHTNGKKSIIGFKYNKSIYSLFEFIYTNGRTELLSIVKGASRFINYFKRYARLKHETIKTVSIKGRKTNLIHRNNSLQIAIDNDKLHLFITTPNGLHITNQHNISELETSIEGFNHRYDNLEDLITQGVTHYLVTKVSNESYIINSFSLDDVN